MKKLYFVLSDLGDHFRVSDYEDNCISNSKKKKWFPVCIYIHGTLLRFS